MILDKENKMNNTLDYKKLKKEYQAKKRTSDLKLYKNKGMSIKVK